MKIKLHRWLLLAILSTTFADDNPELPLCPTSPQFFPHKLPMHCRMPPNQPLPNLPQFPTLPPLPESFFQSESPDKQPPPIPIPIPPYPGMPGAIPGPMPGFMPGPMPGPMLGPMPRPMPGMVGPMPMPIPMIGSPAHKIPVIVMPFYSQDHSFTKKPKEKPKHGKERRPWQSDTDTDTSSNGWSDSSSSSDTSSSSDGFWKGRRSGRRMAKKINKRHKNKKKEIRKKKKSLLTPILQYVTKDGYVIFEKRITKNEAKDWLKLKPELNMVKDENKQKPDKVNEEKPEAKLEANPEGKYQENEYEFNPKSAEEFYKLDEKEEEMKRAERQHGQLKPHSFVEMSNEPSQR